jgi:hypothetical protein
VNNFAASASSGYEFSSVSEKMNCTRLSNLAVVLGSGNEYSDEDESSLETLTSGYKEFASGSGLRETINPPSFSNMNESVSEQPLSLKVAAYVGIDWADEKHDVVLRSVDDPTKSEHQIIKSEINALSDWIAQMQKRFSSGAKDDRPDADLLSELLTCHRDRLKAWKPDDQLTRELASLNEGRRSGGRSTNRAGQRNQE